MATVDQPRARFAAPAISNDELMSFFEAHFSNAAVQNFSSEFLSPEKHAEGQSLKTEQNGDDGGDDDNSYEDDDDGLGYYPDGVKRTLTDDQIAMFRHSEIEALRKEQEKAAERRVAILQQTSEVGEVDDDVNPNHASCQPAKGKSKKKRKAGKAKNHEPKPDLRKRTWDVVEAGLDSLNYD